MAAADGLRGQEAAVAAPAVKSVAFTFDRPDQIYNAGEEAKVTISVTATDDKPLTEGTLNVVLSNDGRDVLREEKFNLAEANPVTLAATLDFPGFIQIRATARSAAENAKPMTQLAGCAFDPEKIEPGLPKPDDFDEFWAAGKKEVRDIPIDVKMEKIENLCSEKHDVFTISFATVNNQRVYGFLSLPKGEGGPFPALVMVPGAGPGTGPDTGLVDSGFVVLYMNVFPYPVPLDGAERKKAYDDHDATREYRYCQWDANDRNKYFFRAPYLGIDRAIDWLAERDDVDSDRIGCFGTSQGGASALILTGLNKNIDAAVSSVPALCDHAGLLKGRSPGWPRLVDTYGGDKAVLEQSRYLDAVNFARSIDVPIRVLVGFIDVTCSPSSVWSAFNVIPSADKKIFCEQKLGHANGQGYNDAINWLKAKVKN